MKPRINVIIPAYNEQDSIAFVIKDIPAVVDEIIVVNKTYCSLFFGGGLFTNDPDFCLDSNFAYDVTVSHVQDGINDIRHNVTHIHRHSVLKSAFYTPSLSSSTIIT